MLRRPGFKERLDVPDQECIRCRLYSGRTEFFVNIKKAKKQIRDALELYLMEDKRGGPCIPESEQRPIVLMGPPGIGKTAVVSQLAEEMELAFVSYSMTHHTRQSALGLPEISTKEYDGRTYTVTDYTMSEIIASVFEAMERTGIPRGILFLDEINCVSETLVPAMLQFLQFKTFGRHRLPKGWILIAAGNPPEYNRSARDFDVVTWDRVRRMDIEPDLSAWNQYMAEKGLHPAVHAYLMQKPDRFYRMNRTVDGTGFVTARGWSDLGGMLTAMENAGFLPDKDLIGQYLQETDTAGDFFSFYRLFMKYHEDYQIDRILEGREDPVIRERAAAAPFDERVRLLAMLNSALSKGFRAVVREEEVLGLIYESLVRVRDGENIAAVREEAEKSFERQQILGGPEGRRTVRERERIAFLAGMTEYEDGKEAFLQRTAALDERAEAEGRKLSKVFSFSEKAWGEGQEMLLLMSELTADPYASAFIGLYGSPDYRRHSKLLSFGERGSEIRKEIRAFRTL